MEILYRALWSVAGVTVFAFLLHILFHAIAHRSLHSRTLAAIIGFVASAFGIFIFILSYRIMQDIPARLEPIPIDEIPAKMAGKEELWLSIPDGHWDCSNMASHDGNTYAALLNREQSLLIVAHFDDEKTCEELQALQPSGSLAKFVTREYFYTSNFVDFAKYGAGVPALSLCAYCGRKNSQLGLAAGVFFLLLGMLYGKIIPSGPPGETHKAEYRLRPRD